jgi:adenine-specific DNA methylase
MKEDESQSRLAPIDKDRRLIEEFMPIGHIGEESSNEKGIRRGYLSNIHHWWARRPLIASRAAVFASLVKYPYDKKKKENILNLMNEVCKWSNTSNNRIMNNAKKVILESFGGKTPKVIDCFAGGGSIPLEAARLGCESYSNELNPVAYLIELCSLVYPQKFGSSKRNNYGFKTGTNPLVEKIKKWSKEVFEKSKRETLEYFTSSPSEEVIGYVWARTVKCNNPSCGAEIPLIGQYWISRKRSIAIKPILDNKNKIVNFEVVRGKDINFDPKETTMKRGSAECLLCNNVLTAAELKKKGLNEEIKQRLLFVVTKNKGKNYRIAQEKDLEAYERSKKALRELLNKNPELYPNEKTPINKQYSGARLYGLDEWGKLFNDRQLLSQLILLKNIQEVYPSILNETKNEEFAKAIVTYLVLGVSKLADRNCNLVTWGPTVECPTHVFARSDLPMAWDYSEINPFSSGSGNYLDIIKGIISALEGPCFQFTNPVKVMRGDATNLNIKDNEFDAVITDPPYYDAVPYSDLSDFFYVWLKRGLSRYYPDLFRTPLTPKSKEIVQNPERHENDKEKAKEFYENEMTKAFKEFNRILKENGIFVVVFAHKTTSAWETLINSLLNANFVVSSSWPLHTERKSRLRARGSAALASSIFIVCRKKQRKDEGYFNDIKDDLVKRIHKKLDEFWSQGIRGADFFFCAIGPAVEVFGKYKRVMKLSGEEVSVAELLDLVREIVTDYSLEKILHGRHMGKVDEQTRFYLLWRWAYDDNDVPYDDARKLAQALGTEADELLNKKDMLEKKGDKVNLMEPWQRKKNAHLGEPKGGIPAPMIDVIHKACLLWEKGNKQELSEFIENSGYADDDTIWNVAQAISEVLPDGNKEKQLIQGLLASKHSISKDVSSKQGKLGEYFK